MSKQAGRGDLRGKLRRRRLLIERLGDRRVLAAITGTVFEDANESLRFDPTESAAPQRLVYIDANENGQLDFGDPYALADEHGLFEFVGLPDGSYSVRLFNAAASQSQTTPFAASLESGSTVSVDGGIGLVVGDGRTLAFTNDSVVVADLTNGANATIPVGNDIATIQLLPDGNVLAVSGEIGSSAAWIVDVANETSTSVDLSGDIGPTGWSDVALGDQGSGVLIEQSEGAIPVRAIRFSESSVTSRTTSTLVPSDTQVLASLTGSRTVFAWGSGDGLQLSLWSNPAESFITSVPIDVPSSSTLLDFDDASGLLALRTNDGGVSILDVDASFATLHTFHDLTGPVAIDGTRELLMSISPVEALLRVIDLRDGSLIADLAIDTSTIGTISDLAITEGNDGLVVLGAAGIAEIGLRQSAAHEITIEGGQDADPVLFGVALSGHNAAPAYARQATVETIEDTTLSLAARAALEASEDLDGDEYVLLQIGDAANGAATIGLDGSVFYSPAENFHGVDSVAVLLHDGRDATAASLEISVISVPEPLTGASFQFGPVFENVALGTVIGTVEVVDNDGFHHTIEVDDPRFGQRGNEIILVGGNLNYEAASVIPLTVTVTDPETNDVIEQMVSLTIKDADDPITAITPTSAFVIENAPGDLVAELFVHDEDVEAVHILSVDDERFMFDDDGNEPTLRLRDGISVDFEQEQTILVTITATDQQSGDSFDQPFTIVVRDVHERPLTIGLTNATVMELVVGAEVGAVTLDNGPPSSSFELSVDDSRFEVENNTLKLRDDVFVEAASQAEIEIVITASDNTGQFPSISETFIIELLENEHPSHNHDNPPDVDHSGDVSAIDALVIVNYLNNYGPGPVTAGDPAACLDVNADGFVTALDALLVIAEMQHAAEGGAFDPQSEQLLPDSNPPIAPPQPFAQPSTINAPPSQLAIQNIATSPKIIVVSSITNLDVSTGTDLAVLGDPASDESMTNEDDDAFDIALNLISNSEQA